jgi:hypothetical protein
MSANSEKYKHWQKKTNDNRIRNALFADAELTKLLEQVSIPHVLIIR